jgi:hypothetical protein
MAAAISKRRGRAKGARVRAQRDGVEASGRVKCGLEVREQLRQGRLAVEVPLADQPLHRLAYRARLAHAHELLDAGQCCVYLALLLLDT